jgi:hypothetical protein
MRGRNPTGRFDAEYEVKSIRAGISRDLQVPVGQTVKWYLFDSVASRKDPVYDVGSNSGGRVWKAPIVVPVVNAFIYQADQFQNDRGFYTVDTLRIVINYDDVIRYIPTLDIQPDVHLLDRVDFRGALYTPNRVFPKGQIGYEYMGLLVEATQVKPEEEVNDTYGTSPSP